MPRTKSKTPLTRAERSERARIAANTRWSRLSAADRLTATAPGRRAMLTYFEKLVDPDEVLSVAERTKLAANARAAQLAQARLKSLQRTRARRRATQGGQ